MGNRDYKESGESSYSHVYNRGNAKNDIFLDKDDFNLFILKLNENLFPDVYKPRRIHSAPLPVGSFSLISYCLMPNHFHLLLRQNREDKTSLSDGAVDSLSIFRYLDFN